MKAETRDGYSLAIVSVGTALVILFAGASVIAAVNHEVPKELWAAASALSGALVGLLVPPPQSKGDPAQAAQTAKAITESAATGAAGQAVAQILGDVNASDAVKVAAQAAMERVAATAHGAAPARPAPLGAGAVIGVVGPAIAAHEANLRAARAPIPAEGNAPGEADAQAARAADVKVQTAAVAGAQNARAQATAVEVKAALTADVNPSYQALKVIIPFAVFAVSLAAALLISGGVLHPAGCALRDTASGKLPACEGSLLGVGNALLALASAAGGALIGLFGTPPSGQGA